MSCTHNTKPHSNSDIAPASLSEKEDIVSADSHLLETRFMQRTNICQAADPSNKNSSEYFLHVSYTNHEPSQFIFLKNGATTRYFSDEN